MVSMLKKATFCLVALSACQAVRGAAPEGEDVTKAVFPLLNLVRLGKIASNRPEKLKEGTDSESTYSKKVMALLGEDPANCTGNTVTSTTAEGFIVTFAGGQEPDYTKLIDDAFKKGLTAIGDTPGKWGAAPYKDNNDANNGGRLLNMKSSTVFCVKAKCTGGTSIVACNLQPPPVDGEAPITAEYLKLLKERVAANVGLGDMTDADLNPPGSGGAMAPSFLLGGLVAALAMVTA